MSVEWITGDVFDGLAQLEDGSVDLVVTSPPFLALRSYLPPDHPDKGREIGSEPTPAAYIDVMLAVAAELRRVLAPHGSICVELGDSYSYGKDGWPERKSKALIPQLFEVALAYGINPLTGAESPAGRWRIRNVVTWCRPNPPVGALGDKWRPATSDVVVACLSDKRYWDDIATRREHKYGDYAPTLGEKAADPSRGSGGDIGNAGKVIKPNPAGAPLLDYWVIPSGGYKGAHYAVYPPKLVEPLVKAMLPPKVCRTCGEPSRRIVENAASTGGKYTETTKGNGARIPGTGDRGGSGFPTAEFITLGWTDCGHDDYRPPVILDPFAGSGTTLAVALGHNPDALAIGIDLDERNELLARDRVGPALWAT